MTRESDRRNEAQEIEDGLIDAPLYDAFGINEDIAQQEVELPEGVALEWFPKQMEFWQAVTSGEYNYLAYGGAIRGGKTFTVLMTIVALMRLFPRSRHIVVRKDLPLIRKYIIPSVDKIRRYSGSFLGPLNKTEWMITATNGSQLLFVPEGLKDDPELNDWRGAECNTLTMEEANELSNKMKVKAMERVGSYVIPPDRQQMIAIQRAREELKMTQAEAHEKFGPKQCPPLLFFTFNPADNWIRDDIYDPWERGDLEKPWFFLPSTIYDNPYNPPAFIKSVEQLKDEDIDAYERFVLGKWGNIRVENQLIDPAWIQKAREAPRKPGPTRLGADIARYGRDSTVFVPVEGNAILKIDQHRHIDTVESASIVTLYKERLSIAAQNIVIDVGGLGAGTVDNVRANGIDVPEFVMGAMPVRRRIGSRPRGMVMVGQRSFYHFKNLWSQAAWEAREKLRNGEVALLAKHPNISRHLSAFRYEITNREISVWSSDDVREELGFSPDVGVAVILALFEFPERHRGRLAPSVVLGRQRLASLRSEIQVGESLAGRGMRRYP
jgi:hypothetical protein